MNTSKLEKKYPSLFSPITIRGQVIKNRIKSSPHGGGPNLYKASDKGMSDFTVSAAQYYGSLAKGGAGMVCTGHLGVDPRFQLGANGEHFNFTSQESIHEHVLPTMHMMTDLIHAYGAKASIELNHGGTRVTPVNGNKVLGPCSYTLPNGNEVVAMGEEEMKKVADYFANAALIGKRGGFDIINIHAGHGWLLSDFLSPLTNKRSDKFGGSAKNRTRFPKMVFKAVREAVGEDIIIEFRFSANEVVDGGITVEDAITSINILAEYADLVHCSSGKVTIPMSMGFMMPLQYMTPGMHASVSEEIRKHVSIPVEVLGGIGTPDLAEEIVKNGKADIVGIARSFIADPDWTEKVRYGLEEDIIPCIRCLRCLNYARNRTGSSICTVNPRRIMPHPLAQKSILTKKRKVVVIGGGPAGMQAAYEISKNGHDVVIYEKENVLGGRLVFADHIIFKEDVRRYKDYLITQVNKAENITVKLGVAATKDIIESEKPDAVIAAIGSKDIIPPIKGSDNKMVVTSTQLFGNEDKLGNKVVIIGGGSVGCEASIHLAEKGKTVNLIEMTDTLIANGEGTPEETRTTIFYLSHKLNMDAESLADIEESDVIKTHMSTKCTEITDSGVWVENDSGKAFIEADNVIIAAGYKIDKSAVSEFEDLAVDFITVGDCKEVGSILTTSSSGYYAALQIG